MWACNNDVKRMAGERVTRRVRGAVAMINNAGPKALRDEKNPGKRHMSSAFEAYRRCKETFSLWRLIFRSSAGSRMRSVISSEASATQPLDSGYYAPYLSGKRATVKPGQTYPASCYATEPNGRADVISFLTPSQHLSTPTLER